MRAAGTRLSYRELARQSSSLAASLRAEGVRRGDRVAVLLTKRVEAIVALYGILKTGAVAVPLDPTAPPMRQAAVLRDCGVAVIIAESMFAPLVRAALDAGAPLECAVVVGAGGWALRELAWDALLERDPSLAPAPPDDGDVAYVLYTSGSTGAPKGIAHTHASAATFARWGSAQFALREDDRLGNHAPLHFDLSVFDVFAAAVAGATTVLVPRRTTMFPRDVVALLVREQITVWYSVPSMWIEILRHAALDGIELPALRAVLFAGERFPPRQLDALMQRLPRTRFYNLFGPTETNVALWHEVAVQAGDALRPLPIGRPCPYAEIRVEAPPSGRKSAECCGELLVRGATVMQGYWNQPGTTASAFTADGFYRTGDIVRRDDDGVMHFVGRRDRQVKVRGVRVELDEIEHALLAQPGIVAAAAWLAPRAPEKPERIEAAFVTAGAAPVDEAALLAALARRLHGAAVPLRAHRCAALPKTATGKVDRTAAAAMMPHDEL